VRKNTDLWQFEDKVQEYLTFIPMRISDSSNEGSLLEL
jgi:hypothetical protein